MSRDTTTTRDVRCSDCLNVTPLTLPEKADRYVDQTFSPRAVLSASVAAAIAQVRHTPQEWGSGLSGYGRRDAAAYGGSLVTHTTEFGIGALLGEDPRFEPSARTGLFPRTADALYHAAFVRTDDGGRQLAVSRIFAAFATGFAVNSWEPRRLHSTHHAVMLSLGALLGYGTAGINREFSPDVKRYLFRKLHIHARM